MKLSADTKIHELLATHPFLEKYIAGYHPKFEMLGNPVARATIGRVATLRAAAGIAGVDVDALVTAIAAEIGKQTGRAPQGDAASEAPPLTREQRLEALTGIIRDLHAGGDLE